MGQRARSIKGFNDVLPDRTPFWQELNAVLRSVTRLYGYAEIRLPVVESTELFARSVGESSDIVEKEMFSFEDQGGRSISLRPEGTAGCVRAGIDHGLLHNQQQRLWYTGPMFRHEKPQAGRYRQFEQLGAEAFGMAGPDIDAELIALSARVFSRLGLLGPDDGLQLELNTLGSSAARAAWREALVAYFGAHHDALDEDSRRRLHSNPLRILDSKVASTREIAAAAPAMDEFLDAESRSHFDGLREILDGLNIHYVLNTQLVRGLDYYTHTVFEWTTDKLGAQGTVCAGGRYDGLTGLLGGGDVPAVGFAMGLDRLVLLMETAVREPPQRDEVYICWSDAAQYRAAATLAESLRDAGIAAVLHAGGGKLDNQFKRARKSAAAAAVLLGDRDAEDGAARIRWLRDERKDEVTPLAGVPTYLKEFARLT